jgi:choline dehydrogenase-like flavoprotein
VVANRLSKDPQNKVLVLEDGGDPNPFTTVPALWGKINQPSTDYGYTIVKQTDACLANDGVRYMFMYIMSDDVES